MISMNWVKDYIDIEDENLEELADKVTKAGINVEHVIKTNIDNVVIGEVKTCVDHPDSDHLHICEVNVGTDTRQIVCGAPNVKAGIKVIVALPGAKLPGGEIKKGSIRGQESNGMICALCELGLEEDNEENYKKGIHVLPKDAPVGTDAFSYLGVGDTLYDLDIHKHKNNDCRYHIGFAYEIGTILGKKVKLPKANYSEIKDSIKDQFNLKVDTDKCTYYKAKMVTDLVMGESPDFIKNRLISAGMRPINNIVDISNYVMLEYGQPLHFFDKDKLGDKIVVRMAKDDEVVTTLDEQERNLTKEDIVITDGSKVVAIGGVMGALNTDVDENTKTVLIESAIFNATNIRKTARRLNLRSEASLRYEKGLNFEYTDAALDRACYLLEKYASGKVLSGKAEYDNEDKKLKKIEFTTDKVNSLLGIELTDKDVETELKKLDFEYEYKDGKFITTIPRRRLDIEETVNDITEEIGRLYGYHNINNTLPVLPTKEGKYEQSFGFKKTVSYRMRTLGLNETRTYSLVDKKDVDMFYKDRDTVLIPDPMSSDRSALRKTMIPSLLEVVKYNKTRGLKDINIYETSKVFYGDFKEENHLGIALYGNYMFNQWQGIAIKNDFYVLKGIISNLLDYLGLKNRYSFVESTEESLHPGISADIYLDKKKVGFFGRIHPKVNKDEIYVLEVCIDDLDVKTKDLKFKAASKLPYIKKDVAFIMPKSMKNEDVVKEIKRAGSRLLTDIQVFDLYEGFNIGVNNKSIAYSLTFEDSTRTLTDEEVMEVFNNIIKEVETKLGIKLRNM
ncbi:MAG: phenylalanine--tRNA ligase subunit beta [Bacilli bacterium]|nr:phenylalanine--tRNA ligase subunit beta [Bacilli bacterium]